MSDKIKVLVVDDSSFFRKRIKSELLVDSRITVIGEAEDGASAVKLAKELAPDLITMDVAMPVMDGIQAVRAIMRENPIPIIMFSSLTQDGARSTLQAMDAGAVDFVAKQSQVEMSGKLRDRVLAIANSPAATIHAKTAVAPALAMQAPATVATKQATSQHHALELVVIGASTGGPIAVQSLLSALPADFPFPILVAIHMPSQFTMAYAARLNSLCALSIKLAENGDELKVGQVLIAPGGQQTALQKRAGTVRVKVTESVNEIYQPSINLTFASVAQAIGRNALAIVLTGMGNDGLEGGKKLKQVGAKLWGQDEASSVVYGMPHAVNSAGVSDLILPLQDVAAKLLELK